MAMLDYIKKNAGTKIIQTKTKNAHGNYTVIDTEGGTFDALLVKRVISEETIGAERTKAENKYNLFVPSSVELEKDDKIKYTYRDGNYVYVRLTSGAILNDELSRQTEWKTYEAETYTTARGTNEQ